MQKLARPVTGGSSAELPLLHDYKMDGVKLIKGDIFNPNITGHECIVCHIANSNGQTNSKLEFHSVKVYGFDYNISTMLVKETDGDNAEYVNLEAFRKALKEVCIVATPLPVRTLTTVRIPYMLGLKMTSVEWNEVYQIILKELADKGIPVEIWHDEEVRKCQRKE